MKKLSLTLITIVLLAISPLALSNNSYLIAPTGPYGVGFQDVHVVEGALTNGSYTCVHPDVFYIKGKDEQDYAKNNQQDFCRELMVRVYYPTQKTSAPNYALYYPAAIKLLQDNINSSHIPGVTPKEIAALSAIKTFTIKDAPIISGHYPVILFEPGGGMEVEQYNNIISTLVSHGYIVVGNNNTFNASAIAFPDGRIIGTLPADIMKLVEKKPLWHDWSLNDDLLTVRQLLFTHNKLFAPWLANMNLTQLGIFGHSAGAESGVVPAVRSHADLFQAAVALDGMPIGPGSLHTIPEPLPTDAQMQGFPIPFLWLYSAGWHCFYGSNPMHKTFELNANNYVSLLSAEPANQDYCGNNDSLYTGHGNLTDFSTLQYQPAINASFLYAYTNHQSPRFLGLGVANGVHIAKITDSYVLDFFDLYLKGKPSSAFQDCIAKSRDSLLRCAT